MELYLALFLFFIGTGASTITISTYYMMRYKNNTLKELTLVKYSLFFALILLLLGVATIIWEIFAFKIDFTTNSFESLNLFHKVFLLFISDTHMDFLVVFISILIPLSILYLFSFNSSLKIEKKREQLTIMNLLLSLITSGITASLLHGLTHNIIWDNYLMVLIFFISTLCSGFAVVTFFRTLVLKIRLGANSLSCFSKTNLIVLSFGFWMVLLFTFALSIICISNEVNYVLNISYQLGKLWWFGVVIVGFIIPLVIYAFSYFRTVPSFFKYVMVSSVLCGAFCLNYTVLLAGQFM